MCLLGRLAPLMIYIGTDLVEVDRIRSAIEKWSRRFLERVFTPEEITYCQRQSRPALHFAGRFAAKEAVKKALYSAGRQAPVLFRQIQIDRETSGVPRVTVAGLERQPQVSISHVTHLAVATALYESP